LTAADRNANPSMIAENTVFFRWTRLISGYFKLAAAVSHQLTTHNRNHTCNAITSGKTTVAGSQPVHGLHMLPHSDSRHLAPFPQILNTLMHFPQVPPRPVNCSSLEAMYTGLEAMIYMRSQHRPSPQLSCRQRRSQPTLRT
jgi:hypothetical protein